MLFIRPIQQEATDIHTRKSARSANFSEELSSRYTNPHTLQISTLESELTQRLFPVSERRYSRGVINGRCR